MKKMSRSIKDYKDAMDSIRISESFYKRTETLLGELPEAKIEKRPFYMSRKITAGIMAAAACIICVIGIRTVIDIRQDNIESVSETGLTEIERETEISVPELIDILEDEDSIDEMFMEDEAVAYSTNFDEESETEEESPDHSKPLTIDAGEETATATTSDKPAKTENGNEISKVGAGSSGTGASSTVTTGGTTTTGGTDKSGRTEASTEQKTIMLDDVSFEHVTVEITPYFDMDDIVSGESSVKESGTDCRELIEYLHELSESSYKIPNSSFKSLFSLNIADESIGVTFYSIYVTNLNTMIITKHDFDGQQRVTYGLSIGSSRELKKKLFLMFGEEADYELFENLISGK